MADFLDEIIHTEGDDTLTDDPDDAGGLTKFGISQAAHPHVDIARLTYADARHIYETEYLIRPGIDKIAFVPLRNQLLDCAVNLGVPRTIKLLQFILRIDQDGVIGPKTLAALAARDATVVNNMLVGAREAYYYRLAQAKPKNKKFLKGWLRRAHKFFLGDVPHA